MINLAIIIAVSEYCGEAHPLPGCKNDGTAISILLNEEQKFADTLVIDSKTLSSSVKQRLVDFFARHKDNVIGEVFFYFSGHGEFYSGEFYYLLSDYRSSARKQTSLENTELDNMVRSLQPSLFVKVVDACHSGLSYVKDGSELRKHLDLSINNFKKIYFMFSSQLSQYSYQDAALSYFTRRFVESVSLRDTNTVRYKDIIDYVSDAFALDTIQTPFFVTQADHTEIFLEMRDEKKNALKAFLPTNERKEGVGSANNKNFELVDLVKVDAQAYCSEEQTMVVLEKISEQICSYVLPPDLGELYETDTERMPLSDFTQSSGIGIWIDQNLKDKRYFVSPTREIREAKKKVLKNQLFFALNLGPKSDDDYMTVTENKQFIIGITPSVELPFGVLALFAEPKYLNLFAYEMYVVPIVSMNSYPLILDLRLPGSFELERTQICEPV